VSVKDRSQRLSFKNMGTMAAERILVGFRTFPQLWSYAAE
jgi:hypothetical protein